MSRRRSRPGGATPEAELMLALCRRAGGDREPADLAALRDAQVRSRLLALAARHRLLGLVASTMTRVLDKDRDAALRAEMEQLLRHLRRRAAIHILHRDRVVTTLRRHGVRAVVLKGAALVAGVYDDPVLRDLDDLDVLVGADAWKTAVRALRDDGYVGPKSLAELRGYRRHHFHIPLDRPDSHCVEVHWALVRADSPFRLAASEVLEGAVVLGQEAGPGLEVPSDEHMVLHLVLQHLQETFSCVGRLVDIHRIVTAPPGIDWRALVATARRGGLQTPTALTFRLGQRLLGTPVPHEVIRELGPAPLARTQLAALDLEDCLLRGRLARRPTGRATLEFWLLADWRSRRRWLERAWRMGPAPAAPEDPAAGARVGASAWAKLVGSQLGLLAACVWLRLTPRGRDQMRFWSSHARSSDSL